MEKPIEKFVEIIFSKTLINFTVKEYFENFDIVKLSKMLKDDFMIFVIVGPN